MDPAQRLLLEVAYEAFENGTHLVISDIVARCSELS